LCAQTVQNQIWKKVQVNSNLDSESRTTDFLQKIPVMISSKASG
jgi:hypothetical protein